MRILVLPGDGIGPEIARATEVVLAAVERRFRFGLELEAMEVGEAALRSLGTTLPGAVLERIQCVDGVVLGPVSTWTYPPPEEGGLNPSAEIRTRLGLHCNVRPARARSGLGRFGGGMDLVIVREATEGFYADRNMHAGSGEFMPDADTALSLRKVSAAACRRVAAAAFELARERRRKVTAVHKANVLRLSDGLFLREVRHAAAHHPDVALEELLVDAAAALLVRDPERFDVLVTTNMFGDILSDEASELAGGLGLAGSLNVGDALAVAQAQHGSAPDIAGRDVANPVSLIVSAAMLLSWRGRLVADERLSRAAAAIERAVDAVLADPSCRTADLGGATGTARFADHVAAAIARCV